VPAAGFTHTRIPSSGATIICASTSSGESRRASAGGVSGNVKGSPRVASALVTPAAPFAGVQTQISGRPGSNPSPVKICGPALGYSVVKSGNTWASSGVANRPDPEELPAGETWKSAAERKGHADAKAAAISS
jgi:hypothetical protein